MKTAMHFFFLILIGLDVNPFCWKAYVLIPLNLYGVDDRSYDCISVSHAPA